MKKDARIALGVAFVLLATGPVFVGVSGADWRPMEEEILVSPSFPLDTDSQGYFDLDCGPDAVLVGVKGRADGGLIRSIIAVCRLLASNGALGPEFVKVSPASAPGGTVRDNPCRPGYVVGGIGVVRTVDYPLYHYRTGVYEIRLSCHTWIAATRTIGDFDPLGGSSNISSGFPPVGVMLDPIGLELCPESSGLPSWLPSTLRRPARGLRGNFVHSRTESGGVRREWVYTVALVCGGWELVPATAPSVRVTPAPAGCDLEAKIHVDGNHPGPNALPGGQLVQWGVRFENRGLAACNENSIRLYRYPGASASGAGTAIGGIQHLRSLQGAGLGPIDHTILTFEERSSPPSGQFTYKITYSSPHNDANNSNHWPIKTVLYQ